ncbi:flagellar basal-body rod protein FlgG [Saccharophagus degradans]|uniref:Flagellar basal-body rod protein FlgG n=2 Tax=Saccharophagus degradans TaxID=86304 RepID=Q21IL1_SACD2|nr:flagellar basal-body rod protein FlgG [Saccharophagus degradans]ABD81468.1 Flagellar basal-body rod FlgG [Saccharophagus degradans 2-40]MBU2985868.1 flagellar basal-body rod protein FlgG [Saccharophagus degradans]MDO6420981.1 flagellar basal-body rod protein FlgG [Saccharophagus degradans]MDO6606108.1 flagellar basal-body rod protein FlgG [Saccharophagus degradans]WGP00297.1 flagellar basal-body rod protein FlgG [Saccharophagus degradans]
MHAALYVSKTGLAAQDTRLTTIANNLANASTVGFKRDRAVFEDLLYQIQRQPGAQTTEETQLPSGLQLGTGVRVVGTQKQFTPGSLQVTGQSLDVAIDGRGFIPVLQPDGTVSYTRDGQFHLDGQGQVVNASGLLIQPAITIPDNAETVTIGTDGVVSASVRGEPAPVVLGNLQIVDFVNPAGLQAIGGNLFLETASSGNPIQGTPGENGLGSIKQGMLENSNVDIVEEMVNMITTQRAYEMNSKVVSTSDQMLQFITQNI